MQILITGGLGNLGSWLTEYFVANNFDVTVFSLRNRNVLGGLSFKKIIGDISNPGDVRKLFEKQNWDVIIHLASINESNEPGYAKKALDINTWGTRNLLQALSDSGQTKTHLIYFSTFHVYGTDAGIVNEDNTPLSPKNDYGSSHLFAEYYIKQFHNTHRLPFTILRLTNSYGCPKEKGSSKWYLVLNDLAKTAVEKKKIILNSNGKPKRDFIWVGDVCTAIDKCILKGPANTVFNLGMGASISMVQVAEIVQTAWKKYFSADISIETNAADSRVYDSTLNVSIDKIKNWIDFSPQDKLEEEVLSIFKLLTL